MNGVQVTFKYQDIKNQLFIAPNVDVYHVKQSLFSLFNIPTPEMEIFYNGTPMNDNDEFIRCGCTSETIFIIERVCPIPIDGSDVIRSFILSGNLSLLEESNIQLFLKEWYESFGDIDITIKSYPLDNTPSITYILLIFNNKNTMEKAYEISPADIYDVSVTKQLTSTFSHSFVNKDASRILQKTMTATNQIASTVKQTYDSTLKPGLSILADETKQFYNNLDNEYHINKGLDNVANSVKQFDSQYKISSTIGSLFSTSFNYVKSIGQTIDASLTENEHTQSVYNDIKDTLHGIASGVSETVSDANLHATTEIDNVNLTKAHNEQVLASKKELETMSQTLASTSEQHEEPQTSPATNL